jgi:ribonuclease P protein component
LRRTEFRRVYDHGLRFSTPLFAAFYLDAKDGAGPKVGFTVPRALGKAVIRNRIRRRLREAVRRDLGQLTTDWRIVINPRKSMLNAAFAQVRQDVGKLLSRCGER